MPSPACGHCGYCAEGLRGPTCPECGAPWADEPPRPPVDVCIAVSLCLIAFPGLFSLAVWHTSDGSHWWTPRPLLVILAGFFTASPVGCFLGASLLAGLHAIPILAGRTRLNASLAVPVASLLCFQWVWLGMSVPYGLRYQGAQYVTACLIGQAIVTATLATIWFSGRGRQSFVRCSLFTIISGVWLTTYAFPWLGETP